MVHRGYTDDYSSGGSFNKWINSMSDDEYEDMLDDTNPFGFSDKQEEKALNIRAPPTKEEQEDLDAMQEFTESEEIQEPEASEPVQQIEEPRRRRDVFGRAEEPRENLITEGTNITESGIRITKTGERVTMVREPIVPTTPVLSQPITPPNVVPTRPPPPRNIRARISTVPKQINTSIRSGFNFARRFFRL
jgi:hypothetical protein